MARKKLKKNNRKRNFLIQSFILLFLFIGIGYATLSTSLYMNGNLSVLGIRCEPDDTLYSVLECASNNRELAKKYTGSHHDSFTEEPTKNIYHWYATTDEEGTEIQNRNNVIFGGICWQMIRTTDTGGVKLIYNGMAENGQCLNTRGDYIGFSRVVNSYAKGYMGDSFTYDSSTKLFTLVGNVHRDWWSGKTQEQQEAMLGKFVCGNETEPADGCTRLLYLYAYYNSSQPYVMVLYPNDPYYQFGDVNFDNEFYGVSTRPTNVGYMTSGKPKNYKNYVTSIGSDSLYFYSSSNVNTNYYYADSYDYGNVNANKYTLVDPYQISGEGDYPSLAGKYTMFSTNASYSLTSIYYIVAVDGNRIYYINMSSGNNLSYYNKTYTYGDGYTDNGDGTYSISTPSSTFNSLDYLSYYEDLSNKYACVADNNGFCNNVLHIFYTSPTAMYYINSNNKYKFSNSYSYDDSTSKYTLSDDGTVYMWDFLNDLDDIENARYTCKNQTGVCSPLNYVYGTNYVGDSTRYLEMLTLFNGESLSEALEDIFSNTKNSTIKDAVEVWFEWYLSAYEYLLEDTIYCNDRSLIDIGGLDPNNPIGSHYMYMKEVNATTDLSCPRVEDQFSVSNNDAKLKHKVGLMTSPEMNLLNNNNARKTGKEYWLMSGASGAYYLTYTSTYVKSVDADGNVATTPTTTENGLRPAISLAAGAVYISGNGSMESPYIVRDNYN